MGRRPDDVKNGVLAYSKISNNYRKFTIYFDDKFKYWKLYEYTEANPRIRAIKQRYIKSTRTLS